MSRPAALLPPGGTGVNNLPGGLPWPNSSSGSNGPRPNAQPTYTPPVVTHSTTVTSSSSPTPRTSWGDVYTWNPVSSSHSQSPPLSSEAERLRNGRDPEGGGSSMDGVFRPLRRPRETLGTMLTKAEEAIDRAAEMQEDGKYSDAIEEGEKAREWLEASAERPPAEIARALSLLGGLYWARGDFARAETVLQRALAIHEATVSTNHPDVASSLDRLAVLYQTQGLYGRAEPLHKRALAIQEAVLGRRHADVATSLNHLAILYRAQGLYARAEPLQKRALLIRETALGTNHPDVAFSLNNLTNLYKAQGLYDRAEPLHKRALAIQEAVLGAEHPDVAFTLYSLATLYMAQGAYAQAEPLLQRALAIQEASLGATHPTYATTLGALATLHREQGAYAEAEQVAQRALTLREAAFGENHPDIAASLNDLARILLARNDLAKALPLLSRAFTLSEGRLRREALDFSEARLAGFLQFLRADEERLYALLRAHPDDEGVRNLALTAALLRKGRSLEETANTSRTVYRSLGARDRETFQQLRELRSQLARMSLDGPGALPLAEYQRRVKELVGRGDALEADLAKRSARLRALTALPSTGEMVAKVAAALPRDGALVEFIAYADRPLVPVRGQPRPPPGGELRYLAMVLLPDARIRTVDLGPAAPIDTDASRLRDALASRDASHLRPAQALHARVFQPLLPLLGGVRRVFLSPDGQLAVVPFATLHDGRDFLVDTFDFTYLTSGKDLLARALEDTP
ncbi:MAG TPA: tetratricopeptide repeat protein, partial [Longimicrobium sp.]|nr:tetratricopeptide repeat protein [Longimicrobium sp.]